MPGQWTQKKILAAVLISAAVLFGATATLLEFRARAELDLARVAASKPDIERALKHYRRALNWYVPGGTWNRAAEDLLVLAEKLKAEGRDEQALLALSRLRSGLYGARSFYTPRADLLDRINPMIALWRAEAKLGKDADPAELGKLSAEYLNLLTAPLRPETGPALATVFGFIAWVAGCFWFIFLFFDPVRGGFIRAWPSYLPMAAGFVFWIAGMLRA